MAVCPNCHTTNPEVGAACPRCKGFHYVPEESVDDHHADPIVGRMTAGKYVILGLISSGGMGAVYRALQTSVERQVAIKVLRTELKDTDNGKERFTREARAVGRLIHPNIVTMFDFGFDESKYPYMVMEYAPGKSLERWLLTERVTTDRVLRVVAQILGALNEAHAHGIIHRDLKPANMIISPRPNDPDRVKLLDFGIARLINENSTRGITREGEVFGTPHYMAPEQAQGRKDIGPTVDIYAVGIMMWEMLCGECPFDADTPLSVLYMHISDPLPPLRPSPGVELIPGLQEVIERATAKRPQDRYQTANEMLADILALYQSIGGQFGVFGEISTEFARPDVTTGAAAVTSNSTTNPQWQVGQLPSGALPTTDTSQAASSSIETQAETGRHTTEFEQPRAKQLVLVLFVLVFVATIAAIVVLTVTGGDASTAEIESDGLAAGGELTVEVRADEGDDQRPIELEQAEVVEPIIPAEDVTATAVAVTEAVRADVVEEEPLPEKIAEKPPEKPPAEKPATTTKSTASKKTSSAASSTKKPPEQPTHAPPQKFTPPPARWDRH